MAIKSIARVLPNWEKWAKQARELFQDATYPLPMNTPKFLVYTVNDFTIHNGKPANAFQRVIKKIDEAVNNILIPSLDKVNMLLPIDTYQKFCLAEIPNFHGFQSRSQEQGVPVFELTDEMIGSRTDTLENQRKRREKLNTLFSDATDEVLRLMNYAESH
jgi:hypothetical protein